MTSSALLQAMNGVSFAALLFLLASGFTLSFGLMRVVNMAHGAYYLFGGYVGLSIARASGSFTLAIIGGGVELPGGMIYPAYRLMLVVLSLVVGVLLWLVYHRTQLGAVIRAGVDDREMVGAIGINVDRLFIVVSALASFLAGMAGVVGGAFLTLYPGAEWEILVFALVVVIFGGLGSLEGAMIGALIVGLLDAYGRWLLPEFSYFVLFGPMALLLLFRPTGLFGKAH
jgi:branched-chain amino acid transport system permease protein